MQIRRCTASDLETVYRLEHAYIECPWAKDDIAAALADEHYAYFLADEGVGYAGVRVVLDDAEIINIAVDEKFRRQGYGGKLLDAIEREAKARGATRILLEVNVTNPAATLYKSKGYAPMTYRKQYYPNGETAAVMAKNL